MAFPTKYNCNSRSLPSSEVGSRKKKKYKYDEKHQLVLSGEEEDTQDLINSYADQCDINVLIKRFTLGDYDALNQVRGFYADVTKFPTSYIELYQKIEDCKKMFESLKPEIREEFGNNPVEFFETYGTDEFIARVKKYNVDTHVPVNLASENNDDSERSAKINEF